MSYDYSFYQPSAHAYKRYRQRMSRHVKKEGLRKEICNNSSRAELDRRINYMLLFSVYGEPGDDPDTEVRYYFDWDLVINYKRKEVITMFTGNRKVPLPAAQFGDRKLRDMIYDLFFRPNSKLGKSIYEFDA